MKSTEKQEGMSGLPPPGKNVLHTGVLTFTGLLPLFCKVAEHTIEY